MGNNMIWSPPDVRYMVNDEEMIEHLKIQELERRDRKRYVDEIMDLCGMFTERGVSMDVAVQLAAAFFNDPEIRKRRNRRKKNEK